MTSGREGVEGERGGEREEEEVEGKDIDDIK